MIEKCCKHTDNTKYKHSHQKNAKSEVKHLTRSSVPDTIFSNKQQATSNKQQATSNKQQAIKRHKLPLRTQTNSQLNTSFLKVPRTHKSKSPSLCVFYITPCKKPQGTQSVELRSTSQSNNRHVLRIETGQSKLGEGRHFFG